MLQSEEQVIELYGEDVNKSLLSAVNEGRLEKARKLITSFGLSYSQAWQGGFVLLRSALQKNHVAVAKLLLTSGSTINKNSKNRSNTALHFAVRTGNIEIVQMILDKGANIDAKNQDGRTPLHNAIISKEIEVTELLLKHGADAHARDNCGTSPLLFAIDRECVRTIEHLLKYGAYINFVHDLRLKNFTPLHFAVEFGSKEVITLLLSRGADVNAKGEASITPLHIAARKGYTRIAEDLLNHGASTHSLTLKEEYTPLHFACELDNEEIVKLFLNRGADINASTKSNLTPLHIATKKGCKTVVKLLLQHGAKVDYKDKGGKTILYLAVEKGYLRIVEDVLKYCPDINNKSNRSSLKIAVYNSYNYGQNYKKIVEALLEYGLLVNPEDVNYPMLLHAAVKEGYLKIIETLLKYGADVNTLCDSEFKKNFTLLHSAVKNKHEEVAKLLISYEADVNAQDETGKTPLFYAIDNADLKITKLLLTNRANIKDSPELLNLAVKKKCIEIVEALLQHDVDINASDKCGRTPIFYAIESANLKIAKLLLTNRANIKVSPELLNLAVKKKCIEIVEALLQHDVDINASDKCGITALHFTTISKDYEFKKEDIMVEIAKLLLSKGANVDAQTKNGVTTLHAAVEKGYAKVVKALLEYNANVNSKNVKSETPLHLSAQTGNEEISIMLLNKGADVNAKQKNGITALHIAAQEGDKEIVKLLLECGAEIDSKTENGVTPLHLGAKMGCEEIIEIILKFGADINSRDEYGRTALHIASEEGFDLVVETLLMYGSDINITSGNNRTPLDHVDDGLHYNYDSDDSSYDSYDNSFDETAEVLRRHIVKMKTANLYVSENNLRSMTTTSYTDRYNLIADFQHDCEKEIASIKSEKINNTNISFNDILVKDTNSLATYMRNENIVQVLKSDDYKTKFPIYASMIENNFKKSMERKELLEQDKKIFHFLFNNFPELPYDCTEKIFSYLSNKDLRFLMDVCKPFSISNPNK